MSRVPCVISVALLLTVGWPRSAAAAPTWVGDFETGDTSQYTFLLNGQVGEATYITVVQDEVAQGSHAARIELHNDAVWPNGLKRVEVQHTPDAGLVAEGRSLCFAFSFYLPEPLPSEPNQTIAYWESSENYQQSLGFRVAGEQITFFTQRPEYQAHWQAEVVTPDVWHRIAMCIEWSLGVGSVDVWFDGEQVVEQGMAQTMAEDANHFVQFGLLRGAVEFSDMPVMLVDDAVEGETLADVRPNALEDGSGETSTTSTGGDSTSTSTSDASSETGGSSTGMGASTTSAAGTSSGQGTTSAGSSTTQSTSDNAQTSTTAGESASAEATSSVVPPREEMSGSGCSCSARSTSGDAWPLGVLPLWWLRRRTRRRKQGSWVRL